MNETRDLFNQLITLYGSPRHTIDDEYIETCKTVLNKLETQWNYTS